MKYFLGVRKLILFMFFILALLLESGSVFAKKDRVLSFGNAKTKLSKIYGHKNTTFYCHCKYQRKSVELKSCKVKTKKFKKRKSRIEWEHVVPAHAFGQSFPEWRNHRKYCPKGKSARKCTAKMNKLFKEMEGNLFNLVPTVGAINAIRSNYSFIEFDSDQEELCLNGLRLKDRKVTPPSNKKGDIARIYFYMNARYPGRGIISNKNKKLYKRWNFEDPVTTEECQIESKKATIQGHHNKFVRMNCKKVRNI